MAYRPSPSSISAIGASTSHSHSTPLAPASTSTLASATAESPGMRDFDSFKFARSEPDSPGVGGLPQGLPTTAVEVVAAVAHTHASHDPITLTETRSWTMDPFGGMINEHPPFQNAFGAAPAAPHLMAPAPAPAPVPQPGPLAPDVTVPQITPLNNLSFPHKLYDLVDNAKNAPLISWCSDGLRFRYIDDANFSALLQAGGMSHNTRSFVRQLNNYGFEKSRLPRNHRMIDHTTQCEVVEYRHKHFRRGQPGFLRYISRGGVQASHDLPGPSQSVAMAPAETPVPVPPAVVHQSNIVPAPVEAIQPEEQLPAPQSVPTIQTQGQLPPEVYQLIQFATQTHRALLECQRKVEFLHALILHQYQDQYQVDAPE